MRFPAFPLWYALIFVFGLSGPRKVQAAEGESSGPIHGVRFQGVTPGVPLEALLTRVAPLVGVPSSGEVYDRFLREARTRRDDSDHGVLEVSFPQTQLPAHALRQLADVVEDFYREDLGYSVATVNFPTAGAVREGVATLTVLEGVLGEVTVSQTEAFDCDTAFVAEHFHLLQGRALKRDDLDRALLTVDDLPGIRLAHKPLLKPGSEPGTTDLAVFIAAETQPIHGEVRFSTFGSRYASRERISESFTVSNLSGKGDALSLQFTHAPNVQDLRYAGLSYQTPLNARGTRLQVSVSGGDFEVAREFAALDLRGNGHSYGLSVAHPLRRSARQSLTLEAGLNYENAR